MIVNLYPFVKIPAKVVILRRSDFAAFYQVIIENLYSPLLNEIREEDVVIDAGANIGLFSILASFKVGEKGKVIAIEPEPDNLKLLKQNVELNNLSNIVIVPKALYDSSGKKVSIKGEGVGAYVTEEMEGIVETITLDKLAEELRLKARILKMDIEGSEGKALLGSVNTIKLLECIEMEIHDDENMKKVSEVLKGFEREDLKIENISNVFKSFLRHPFMLSRIEFANNFSSIRRLIHSGVDRVTRKKGYNSPFPMQVIYRKKRGIK